MSEDNAYKLAYEREKKARLLAEELLDEKTRSLYSSVVNLEETLKKLKSTQDQLIHSEKMASVGQLVAGVAHEINNPVGFSLSNLATLKEYITSFKLLDEYAVKHLLVAPKQDSIEGYKSLRQKEDIEFVIEDVESLFSEAMDGLGRVKDIATNLKQVSYEGSIDKEHCDINECVNDSIKVVWNQIRDGVELQEDLTQIPEILCHQSEIHQVLMNMLLNASYACEKKGVIKIKTSVSSDSEGKWVVVAIEDNGVGMSKEVQQKIFDPFYTTKPIGVGTGLGLSVSFGIIEKHQGKIEVWSKEGEGAKFKVFLPFQ